MLIGLIVISYHKRDFLSERWYLKRIRDCYELSGPPTYLDGKVADVDAVDENAPTDQRVKAQKRHQERAFPASGSSNDENLFSAGYRHRNTVQRLSGMSDCRLNCKKSRMAWVGNLE